MKILLVSDTAHFALTDVYYGYKHALEVLKVEHECFPFHNALDMLSVQTCLHMMHSRALLKSSGITHIVFVGGLNIPTTILESFPGVKTVVVATEDPHSFDPMKDRLGLIDYYFTNERVIAKSGKWGNVHYCPTAANPRVCGSLPRVSVEEKFRSDIVFLGAMYPNREEMLEGILPAVRENGWDLKILGHPGYMRKDSSLWGHVPPENYDQAGNLRTIPHDETVQYYNGAKVVLNFFRDTSWSPATLDLSNPHNKDGFKAESLNPRAYEVSLCGSFQLLEDNRSEARDVFTEEEVGFFSSPEQLASGLSKYLGADMDEVRRKMASRALVKVNAGHTYIHRMRTILDVLSR